MSSVPPPPPPPSPLPTSGLKGIDIRMRNLPTAEDYQRWDRQMADKRDCNWCLVEKELRKYAEQQLGTGTGVYWRLALVSHFQGLNQTLDDDIKQKAIQTLKWAEKAIQTAVVCENSDSPDFFEAYKWHAIAAGKLALLETDPKEKIKYTAQFLKSLERCVEKKPNDQMVLFMQARFQLALALLNEDEQKLLRENLPNLPKVDLEDGEKKIRKSIELAPDFLDNYITLAYLLVKMPKQGSISDARPVIERGLQVDCITKSDEQIRKELLKIKQTLGF